MKGYKVKGRFSSSCLFSDQTLSLPTSYPSPSALEIYLLSPVFLPHQQQCFSTSALRMGGPIPPLALTTHRPPCHRWKSQEDIERWRGGGGGCPPSLQSLSPAQSLCPPFFFLPPWDSCSELPEGLRPCFSRGSRVSHSSHSRSGLQLRQTISSHIHAWAHTVLVCIPCLPQPQHCLLVLSACRPSILGLLPF